MSQLPKDRFGCGVLALVKNKDRYCLDSALTRELIERFGFLFAGIPNKNKCTNRVASRPRLQRMLQHAMYLRRAG